MALVAASDEQDVRLQRCCQTLFSMRRNRLTGGMYLKYRCVAVLVLALALALAQGLEVWALALGAEYYLQH